MKKDFYKMKLRLWFAKTWLSQFCISNLTTLGTFGPLGDHSFCSVTRVTIKDDHSQAECVNSELIIRVTAAEVDDEAE